MQSNELLGSIILYVVSVGIPLATLFNVNKAKIKEQEHRMTVLEMQVKHAEEKVAHNMHRLDEHDDQNKVMLQLVERVGILTDTVNELKSDIKQLKG